MDSHNPTVRAFVAIEVPGTVCRIMDSARECLSALADDLRWTAPENIHLTLKFLSIECLETTFQKAFADAGVEWALLVGR